MIAKEEIIENFFGADLSGLAVEDTFNVFLSMDEYAKEQAIAFARWIANREGDVRMKLVDQNWYFESDTDGDNPMTEEELFKQYLQETATPPAQ